MIRFQKIIKFYNGYVSFDSEKKMKDFFVCDCVFDCLFKKLSSKNEINYDELVAVVKKKYSDHLFFDFFESSIMICKSTFFYYRKIRKDDFVKEKCCVNLFKIDGYFIGVCVICFMKDVMKSDILNHFKLDDRFRSNGTYLYMQLPIRTDNGNVNS